MTPLPPSPQFLVPPSPLPPPLLDSGVNMQFL